MSLEKEFDGKVMIIKDSGFKYRLSSLEESAEEVFDQKLKYLIEELKKSYSHISGMTKPYGKILKDIRELLMKISKINNQTEFAHLIGLKNYETISRYEIDQIYIKKENQNLPNSRKNHFQLRRFL